MWSTSSAAIALHVFLWIILNFPAIERPWARSLLQLPETFACDVIMKMVYSVKLLLSVFGHGWPRWKWITIWKRLVDVFTFCACILQKSLKTYYGLLSLQKFTWYLPLDVSGAYCVWVKAFNLNFSKVLTKCEQNPRDTAPLRRLERVFDLVCWKHRVLARVQLLLSMFVCLFVCMYVCMYFWAGGGGKSHVTWAGMLVGKFELKLY